MDESEAERREDQLREVDRVLLYISEARTKAEEIAAALASEGAEERLVGALEETAEALAAEHKRLMNRTFYTVPD